jgi:hypothetical protein
VRQQRIYGQYYQGDGMNIYGIFILHAALEQSGYGVRQDPLPY